MAKKRNKNAMIAMAVAALLVAALSITMVVKNGKAAEETPEASYTLPVASNGAVTTLDYSDYDIESVSDVYDSDLQSEIYEQLTALKEQTKATVADPLLVSNPYLTNNNSIYVNFTTTKEIESVSYQVKTTGIPDFSETLVNSGTAKDFESQLIGLIAGQENTVTLTVTYTDGTTEESSFDYTPVTSNSGLGTQLDVTTYDNATELSNGLFALIGDSTLANRVIALVDNEGYVRNEIPLVNYNSMRLSFDDEDNMVFAISNYSLVKMNKLGQVTAKYYVKDDGYILHHDYALDEEGNIIALATSIEAKEEADYVEDRVIKIDAATGAVTEIADFAKLLPDLYDKATGKVVSTAEKGARDIVHINTIQYINDDELILSSRETSSIMKLTDVSTEPKIGTIISDSDFWEGIDTNGATLLQKDGDFTSQFGQHSVTYEVGADDEHYTLYMFNNNSAVMDSRTDLDMTPYLEAGAGTTDLDSTDNSYYYEYEVDEEAGTYKLVKEFAVPYSTFISSVQKLGTNYLVDSGQVATFTEYDEEGNPIATYTTTGEEKFLYRVYKYEFSGYYFE
ncbi:aryl-sulfate sulfotransferase [Enterococcus asini]|uniref:aryl-sulfate sulfotransferase n=1 Tax=Enterococcus asini TaxID=57732 RepID=UPI00288E0CCE|nr:aryl-sulfate sulfotransferase [Enterococcus asini]MDT2756333.1 aryl-sulfate sulfotransferase [Enterococcus asini]